jgi:ribosomal protein S18 acetylase RimI-like enzyme
MEKDAALGVAPGSPAVRPDVLLRPLRAEDLDSVVALDSRSVGPPRRGYFEKRLAAALRRPSDHLQIALRSEMGLVGFLLARVAGGEYGRPEDVVILEALGVDPMARHLGFARRMLGDLDRLARARDIHQAVTQVDWRNDSMLRFLGKAEFELAPRVVLERVVDRIPLPSSDEEIETWPPLVRSLRASDLGPLMQIDGHITGQNRGQYLERKFDEALNDSAIEVSLVAEREGQPVAFAMGRVDFGDFGHVEAVAALDTIGVEPAFARKGFGHALLSQLVENLAALHVKRLETEVAQDNPDLIGFLRASGFRPSQRLSFQREI